MTEQRDCECIFSNLAPFFHKGIRHQDLDMRILPPDTQLKGQVAGEAMTNIFSVVLFL